MKKHGFRSIFSLLLALMMVCSMLPTAAFAEGDAEEQPKTVVVDEKKTEPPAQEQPKDEDPPAPEAPKTFTVTYTDGADGAVFPNQVYHDLSFGTTTPAFDGTPAWEGHTFAGWNPAVAETVTEDVTYTAKWEVVQQEAQSDDQPDVQPDVQSEADGNGATVREQGVPGRSRLTVPPISGPDFGDPANNAGSGNNSTVVLHPSVNNTVTGVKVSVGDTLSGYTIKSISGYDITVDLGKYNVNNGTFRLPYAKDIWYGVDDNKVDYISWAGGGSNRRSEGASALLANGKNTAYYYFKGVPVMPIFTLKYDANGGTGAPNTETYTAKSQYERSHTFTISSQEPTCVGYTFLGWSTDSKATAATYQPSDSINVTSTTTLYAVWQENTPPAPSKDQVANLYRGAVTVECTNESAGHKSESYNLTEGDITSIGAPGKDSNGMYSCQVIIASDRFVGLFNGEKGVAHTPASDTRIAMLYYIGNAWTAPSNDDGTIPVVFKVVCSVQPQPDKPGAPENLSDLIGQITVSCTNEAAAHELKTKGYALMSNSYTTSEVEGDAENGYTYTVTINSQKYVEQFNTDTGAAHDPKNVNATVTLRYTDNGWTVESGAPVVFNVACVTEIVPPTAPDEETVMGALKGAVKITCITNSGHAPQTYDLASGFTPGTVEGNASTGYTYTIFVSADKYVGWYSETLGVEHTLDDTSPKPITLRWNGTAWVAPDDGLPINFNVKCETENPPVDIRKPTFDELKALLSVKVECTNGSATHETKSNLYELKNNDEDSKFEIGEVNQSGDAPTCTVTIGSMPYVAEFDGTTGKTHEEADTTQTVDLVYNKETGKWALENENDAPVVFRVACTTEEPSKPYKPKAEDLLSVVIHCKSDVHNDGLYDLKDGNFTVGEVEGNEADGYTCKVTVEAAQYVNKYVGEMKVNHDIVGEDTKTVTLKYESALERWTVDSTVVAFDVECIPAPNISMLQVRVHCVTPNSSHMDESYDLPEDTTLEYVDAYTRKITVQAAPYVEQYGNGHELADGERESKTITATWNGVKWNFDATSVTFYVKCETQPEVPGDITDEDLAKLKVVIHCTTDGSHTDRTYDLIAGTYRPDYSNDGGFTCYIAVLAAPYVNKYISDTGTNHELVDPQKSSKTITLRWNTETKAWAADSNSVTFDVKCTTQEGPAQKYTVTYTDGVDGVEIFKDQVYADLTAGTATPKFNGTPTRVGYFFAGWNPAVTATVTGNATYTASWKVDSNNNGKPDDEEERYTVTYLDGANGRAFASQVYPGLLSGTATPKFNGTPVRSGYVFIGWSPVWSGTVTGNVTYTATWSTITGGLDKVPKTGDNGLTLALSALLLFSFCGAAACVVSTKKRG